MVSPMVQFEIPVPSFPASPAFPDFASSSLAASLALNDNERIPRTRVSKRPTIPRTMGIPSAFTRLVIERNGSTCTVISPEVR